VELTVILVKIVDTPVTAVILSEKKHTVVVEIG
jgi:hypothetical protein